MKTEKIADILLNLTLDMDFVDNIEMYDEAVADLRSEINKLDKNSSLLNALEIIAMDNEDMFQLCLRK